jgi:hypothetical protein
VSCRRQSRPVDAACRIVRFIAAHIARRKVIWTKPQRQKKKQKRLVGSLFLPVSRTAAKQTINTKRSSLLKPRPSGRDRLRIWRPVAALQHFFGVKFKTRFEFGLNVSAICIKLRAVWSLIPNSASIRGKKLPWRHTSAPKRKRPRTDPRRKISL